MADARWVVLTLSIVCRVVLNSRAMELILAPCLIRLNTACFMPTLKHDLLSNSRCMFKQDLNKCVMSVC